MPEGAVSSLEWTGIVSLVYRLCSLLSILESVLNVVDGLGERRVGDIEQVYDYLLSQGLRHPGGLCRVLMHDMPAWPIFHTHEQIKERSC